jgi:putative ABC transport system permease protein
MTLGHRLRSSITRGLERITGRLPIGWLQLTHSRTRLLAAMAGVTFANVLVFLQLGILGALNGTVVMTYSPLHADILISSSDSRTLTDGSPLSRRAQWMALAVPGVESASPLYMGSAKWRRDDGSVATLNLYGLPLEGHAFVATPLREQMAPLSLRDTAIVDRRIRGIDPAQLANVSPSEPIAFEVNGRALKGVGEMSLGGGFSADGAMVVSDQTFLRLVPGRQSGTPSHLMLRVADGADVEAVAAEVARHLAGEPVNARSLVRAVQEDLRYQTTQRPTGVIFGFGVLIGAIVGIVIVYQVLSTDVADHLREYATFKAMGYPHKFFIGIILEEAVILGVLGFLPGVVLAFLMYAAMAGATGLPIHMEASRALGVFLGTVAACALSGALATRRLKGADPAELF